MKQCKIDGCEGRHYGRGYCHSHYDQWRHSGEDYSPRRLGTLKEEIERRVVPEPNSGCWLWLGSMAADGYGRINYKKQHFPAHRASWIAHCGAVPGNAFVCHKCDVKLCVNPNHLYVGNARTNRDDMVSRDRHMRGERYPYAKLTESSVRAIYKDQRHAGKLSEVYGVSAGHIRLIRRGKSWAHLWKERDSDDA